MSHSARSDPRLRGHVFDNRLVLRVVLRAGQTPGFVLDVDCYLGERFRVFPAVMGTEEQLTRVREQDANIRLRATAIAEIHGGERLGGGYSSGHVALPRLVPSGPRGPAGSGLLQLPYSTAQHLPRRQPSPRRVVYATSETAERDSHR